jgi:hypothetical protein
VVAGDLTIRDAHLVRVGADRAVGFFTIVNAGGPDVLLNALVDGFPVLGIWHRQVTVTGDEIADLAGCGGSQPAALASGLLHWAAMPLPARGVLAVTPGAGQLELAGIPRDAATVPVTFAFDRAGPVTVRVPVSDGPAPVAFRAVGPPG